MVDHFLSKKQNRKYEWKTRNQLRSNQKVNDWIVVVCSWWFFFSRKKLKLNVFVEGAPISCAAFPDVSAGRPCRRRIVFRAASIPDKSEPLSSKWQLWPPDRSSPNREWAIAKIQKRCANRRAVAAPSNCVATAFRNCLPNRWPPSNCVCAANWSRCSPRRKSAPVYLHRLRYCYCYSYYHSDRHCFSTIFSFRIVYVVERLSPRPTAIAGVPELTDATEGLCASTLVGRWKRNRRNRW